MLRLFVTALFAINATLACASELPPGWPWTGISIDSSTPGNSSAYIRYLKLKGVNSIELVLSVRNMAHFQKIDPKMAWKRNLDWADQMLDSCKDNQVTCILTFVQVPLDPSLKINQSSPEFWDSEERRNELLGLTGELAEHFQNRGDELGAYEILNEPLVRRTLFQESPKVWPTLAKQIIQVIREKDPHRFIVLNAGNGGEPSQYKNFQPFADNRIIYGAHVYAPHKYTHQGIAGNPNGVQWPGRINGVLWDKAQLRNELKALAQFREKYNVPVWIGEFSAVRWAPNASVWLCDAVSIFNENKFSWTYFSFNGYHAWNPAFNSHYSPDKNQEWKLDEVGERSERWKILNDIFTGKCT